jgi:hypothetical protein
MATLQKELEDMARAFQDAKEKKKGALRDATVAACLAVRAAARAAAINGARYVSVHWTPTDKALLAGPSYTGVAKDADFREGVRNMLISDFGARDSTQVNPRTKTKSVALRNADFITVYMNWGIAAGTTKSVAPPVSNVSFECPVCLEDKPANILVPCGHHTCALCVSRIQSGPGPTYTKCCPVCKSSIALERAVYATASAPAPPAAPKRKRLSDIEDSCESSDEESEGYEDDDPADEAEGSYSDFNF